MDDTGGIVLATHLQTDHAGELLGKSVAYDGDDTNGSTADHREGQSVVARDDIEVVGLVLDNLVNLLEVTTGFLDGDDVLTVASQTNGGGSLHVDTCTTRDVIEYHWQRSGCCNGLEMLVETFLRGLVVIGADTEDAIDTTEIACLQFLDDSCRIIAAAAHENGDATLNVVNHHVLDFLFLLTCQSRSFARGSEDAEEVGSVFQLPVHESHQSFIIY